MSLIRIVTINIPVDYGFDGIFNAYLFDKAMDAGFATARYTYATILMSLSIAGLNLSVLNI